MVENVCKQCHRLVSGQVCATCNSSSLTSDWSGYVVVLDIKKSKIAQKLGVTLPGKYALKVR